ncbi:MAG TPA: DNA polymerase III subunit alpha, partial [Nitrospiraceae bacterium]|nr:DNA polymerase III subunit alpha [Nitrospiraceae bacterium]
CQTKWSFKETIFPNFRQLSDPHAFTLLREKTYDGARWRYGSLTSVVTDRIERELGVIRDKGYAHYFLVVDEIVRQAPRTCGRGSAAASIVSYCLGITHVDPIRHNLFFERFLNPGRHDPPDIDVDFPWDERDRIVDFVFARYGSRQAGMVANQNT